MINVCFFAPNCIDLGTLGIFLYPICILNLSSFICRNFTKNKILIPFRKLSNKNDTLAKELFYTQNTNCELHTAAERDAETFGKLGSDIDGYKAEIERMVKRANEFENQNELYKTEIECLESKLQTCDKD